MNLILSYLFCSSFTEVLEKYHRMRKRQQFQIFCLRTFSLEKCAKQTFDSKEKQKNN